MSPYSQSEIVEALQARDARIEALTDRVAALEADTKYDDLGQSVRWLHARIDGIENGSIPIAPPEPETEPERPEDETEEISPNAKAAACLRSKTASEEISPAPSPASLDALKAEATGFLPCPFCGSKRACLQNGQERAFGNGYFVLAWCPDCGASGREEERDDRATAAWNRRAYALDRAERPQGETAQDVRERAINKITAYTYVTGSAARQVVDLLASAGLLASQPQRVTVNWNAALDLLYAHGRGPGKSMSDGMLAVLRSIPNLVIEGE